MIIKHRQWKSLLEKAGNVLFIGLLLWVMFSPDVKSWLLQRFMSVGLFNAKIGNEKRVTNESASPISFSFRDEKGNIFTTTELKGKVIFINFWATWCPPCRAEMPALNDLYHQFRNDKRVVFLFLNEDNDPGKAATYMLNNRFIMPVMTTTGNVSSEIYSGTLPTTIIMDKEGKIVYKHEGLARYNSKSFISQLQALL